ncbi:MAG: hypothetical protein EOM22_08055 [Gammaproteobacteria bacterium]|nr:hypothetical protein [Gammaproteobacteria bacterium]
MPGSNSSLVRPLVWVLLAALIGVYLLYDWYSDHLKEQLAVKDAQIAEAAEQIKQREARIGETRKEVTQLEERIAGLTEQHSGEKQQLSDLHSVEKQELVDRIAALEQSNAKLEEDLEALGRTDARALAAEQAKTAAVIEERDLGVAAFKALQGQYEMAIAKAEDLQTELTGLRQVIADSAMEHREQIEALERHLNERVKLAKATPKDSELMRAAQKAGLLPEDVDLDEETAAFCADLAETSASAQTALETLQAEFTTLHDEQAERIAALESALSEARAALAQSDEPTASSKALSELQERIAQAEAELEASKSEASAALTETQATAAKLADAQARIETLTEELAQSVEPGALSALMTQSEAAEAALAQAQDASARLIEEGEAKIAALAEQLRNEQAEKAKVAEEKDALAVELDAALDDARAELADVQAELAAARESAAQTGSKALDDAEARIAALEATIAQERTKTDQMRASVQQAADAKLAEVRALYRRFSELDGTYTDRGVLLKLADTELLFQPGMASLTGSDLPTLDRIAALLETYPDLGVRIEGHTDSLGDAATNLALSQQRADAVKQALIERGVEPGRLTAQGLGPERPIADNATSAGRAQNRRVEVYVNED